MEKFGMGGDQEMKKLKLALTHRLWRAAFALKQWRIYFKLDRAFDRCLRLRLSMKHDLRKIRSDLAGMENMISELRERS
jgi:hypothetical protein